MEEPATFLSGALRRRLEAANLANLEPHQQQELGVAVGQRVMRHTFVLRWDGLDPCLKSDDLTVWPAGDRIGLLRGLWFDPSGLATVTPTSIKEALIVLDPVADYADVLLEQVQRLTESTPPRLPNADGEALEGLIEWVRHRATVRPSSERPALQQLLEHLGGQL